MLLSLKSDCLSQCLFSSGETILFQGDSITDMGRGRTADPNHLLGHGYAFIISAREGFDFPENQTAFINRGISGNTLRDLHARWRSDALAIKPDILSILIGVNDVLRKIRVNENFSLDSFEESYDQLLSETITALPQVKLVLGEPFFASGIQTTEYMEQLEPVMESIQAVIGKLALRYCAPVVQYQSIFNAAMRRAPARYWIWDGVHPTYSGHQLMADEWRRTYRTFYGDSTRNKNAIAATFPETEYK